MPAFGKRTTAAEVLDGMNLEGKTAVVTGGNSGIGVETCRALAAAGATVVLCSRNVQAGQAVADEFTHSGVKGKLHVQQLDLADVGSVQRAADALADLGPIDMLVLNAGVFAQGRRETQQGLEVSWGVNHVGGAALVRRLLPKLRGQATPVRVVFVASALHRRGKINFDDLDWKTRRYHGMAAYRDSKLANILYARELARKLSGTNVTVFSLHPGVIKTMLTRDFRKNPFGRVLNGAFYFLGAPFMKSAQQYWPRGLGRRGEQGAATTVFAATSPSLEGQSGAYLEDCAVTQPAPCGQDDAVAQKLWDTTEQTLDRIKA